jgi:small subunit ribosomal protein S7
VEAQTQEEADKEAQDWLDTIQKFRTHVESQGGYDRDRLFAPSDATDYRFYSEPIDQERFVPSAEQIAQFERTADLPIPSKRDETLAYLVKLTMRHGRKERTQKYVSRALHLVYLKIRTDPLPVLKEVLDKMAPIARMKRWSDGGARAELVPVPLTERQRFRTAWSWILESSRKRPSKDFAVRLSEEIMSAINGKSPGYDKKATIHKTAVVNRSYISLLNKGSR